MQFPLSHPQTLPCLPFPTPTPSTHTYILLPINISQQTQKMEQRELTEAKRQQSILELPWQLVKGKKATAK